MEKTKLLSVYRGNEGDGNVQMTNKRSTDCKKILLENIFQIYAEYMQLQEICFSPFSVGQMACVPLICMSL